MISNFNITILIAPLDWGLGHATRCIPIIQYFTDKGCKVIIAAEGAQKILLEKEFPSAKILVLRGYRIRYSKNKRLFPFKIVLQIPSIINAIIKEHRWLKKVVEEYNINAVISDNRYGLYNRKIPSVFITHQLNIQAPFKWLERIIQVVNYRFINKFSSCWIPDIEGQKNIAGKLSHTFFKPAIPVKYLGGISRLEKSVSANPTYEFVAIISGPEPQRSLFENILFKNAKAYKGKGLIIRGLPEENEEMASINAVSIINHLPAKELERVFNESEFIISRSGYTTIMDILKLQKKSILIPTPGQTEQEYLADHLHKQNWILTIEQSKVNLTEILNTAPNFNYQIPVLQMESYKAIIDDFIVSLRLST